MRLRALALLLSFPALASAGSNKVAPVVVAPGAVLPTFVGAPVVSAPNLSAQVPVLPAINISAAALTPVVPAALIQTPEALAVQTGAGRIVEAVQQNRGEEAGISNTVFDGTIKLAGPSAPVVPAAGSGSGSQLSGPALLKDLHDKSGKGYRSNSYEDASDYMFKTADHRIVNGKSGVMDAYSGIFVPGGGQDGTDYPERGDQNGDGHVDEGMNVEHIWPQSFFGKSLPMRSDLHHLMATFIHPNGVRGHLPFGVVRGQGDYSNSAGAKRGQGVFEPPDAAKGRVARAMLYFYTRYNDRNISNGGFNEKFWNQSVEMFLEWNRRFPPDDFERNRNDLVEKFQGNRNPFVDDPALADRVGADAFKKPARTRSQLIQSSIERRDRRDRRTRRRHR